MFQRVSQQLAALIDRYLWMALLFVPVALVLGPVVSLPIINWYYEITLSELLLIIISLVYGARCLARHHSDARRDRGIRFFINPMGWLLLFYVAAMFLSIFWVASFEKWLIALRVLSFHAAMFFLTINLIDTRQKVITALRTVLFFAFFVALMVLSHVVPLSYAQLVATRHYIETPLGFISYVAAMLAAMVPLTLGAYHTANNMLQKMLFSWLYCLLIIALLYAAGRAALLATLVGVLVMLFLLKQRRWYIVGLTVLSIVFFFTATSVNHQSSYTLQRLAETTTDSSVQFRLLELKTAANIIGDHPLIGVGAGNLKVYYLELTGFYNGEANNIIVQFLGELGLLGFIIISLFGVHLFSLFKVLWVRSAYDDQARALAVSFLAFLLVSGLNAMFEVTIVALLYGILFWYALGLFFAWDRAGEGKVV